MQELEANPEYDVIEYGCLGNCGECFTLPYAYVNGDIVAGETPEQLLQAIQESIREYQKMFEDE